MAVATILDTEMTPKLAEMVFRKAKQWADATPPDYDRADKGMRAVQAKDRYVMTALERMAETLDKMSEDQTGQTRRAAGADLADTVEPAVVQTWKKAYASALDDEPDPSYAFYYAAVTYFVGYPI